MPSLGRVVTRSAPAHPYLPFAPTAHPRSAESEIEARVAQCSGCYLRVVEILITEDLSRPEDGFGLQQALLEEVASGSRDSAALLWTSSRYVGATYPETRLPGFG